MDFHFTDYGLDPLGFEYSKLEIFSVYVLKGDTSFLEYPIGKGMILVYSMRLYHNYFTKWLNGWGNCSLRLTPHPIWTEFY